VGDALSSVASGRCLIIGKIRNESHRRYCGSYYP